MDAFKAQALSLLQTALDNPTAEFREGQWEAIARLIQQRERLLLVQRTGWGKSLVYFLTTVLLRQRQAGPTLLISPLLALMRNQILAAQRLNLNAVTINSTNYHNWNRIHQQIKADKVDILLIAPERLSNDKFQEEVLSSMAQKIGLLVVDEAHCISDWGHDFRPDYRRIVRVLQGLPENIPVLATTATANHRVVEDIKHQLGDTLNVIRGTLTRQSLKLQAINLASPGQRMAWLAQTLPQLPGSGIIYTLTIKDADRLAHFLKTEGLSAKAYHSQLENEQREKLEFQLLKNKLKVLVATTALGMGFDKPDLGFVIHYQSPGSVVNYYQQVGRAGRAVDEAFGILLKGEEDESITDFFIKNAFPIAANTDTILSVLLADDGNGLTMSDIEKQVNLSRSTLMKTLKFLSLEFPAPVVKKSSKWYATPSALTYKTDPQRIEGIIKLRQQEQAQMAEYLTSQGCLMQFLQDALDDSQSQPCGRCANCVGHPLLNPNCNPEFLQRAHRYLTQTHPKIKPRKQFPPNALPAYGFNGKIKAELRAEVGRALCLWGDSTWGRQIQEEKYTNEHFDATLVGAVVTMIRRWKPQPSPEWVTCVPSLNRPRLVPSFAQRVAHRLGLPFLPVITKVRDTPLQKTRENSYQQAHNLNGAFTVLSQQVLPGPVLLIDDIVDSRWTMTVMTALLKQAGSGAVFPVALAVNSFL